MDLIYTNAEMEDIGVLKGYNLDLAFGTSENNFTCEVDAQNDVCKEKSFLYFEGTEYGGIIDKVAIDTLYNKIIYSGRTWHGIMDSKILQPNTGEDYLTVSGEANTIISELITRLGLGNLFKSSKSDSGIYIQNYKMNRYISGYAGITKMLKAYSGKLIMRFKRGIVELSAIPLVDYSKDEQFDTDQISFSIEKSCNHINHVICLGRGELKDRKVIHLFVDALGNVSGKQTLTGLDEVCSVYDNSNAESDDELINGGLDIIKQSWAENSIEFSFDSNDASFDVNDIIGAKELTTGLMVSSYIAKKIVKIEDNATSISYECEDTTGTVASSGYPTSGGKEEQVMSHVGMIIHSTTLDTMEKVISIYGGKKWMKIEGRMLLGANDVYPINSTGGEATHVLTTAEMPSHDHSFTGNRSITKATDINHTHNVTGDTWGAGSHSHALSKSSGVAGRDDWGLVGAGAFGGNVALTWGQSSHTGSTGDNGNHAHHIDFGSGWMNQNNTHTHAYTPSGAISAIGGSAAHNNMPPYKTVYIWERIE